MKLSPTGFKLIKSYEGLRLNSYLCPAGVWTIGYGHTVDVQPNTKIDEKQADALLKQDLVKFEKTVSESDIKSVSVDIRNTKNMIDKACETGVFQPNQSILCNWCGYKTICPVWVK